MLGDGKILENDDGTFSVFRSDGSCIGTYVSRAQAEVAIKADISPKPCSIR